MKYLFFILIFCSLDLFAEIEQTQALSFGKLVILNNDEPQTFRIDRTGDISYSNAFRIFTKATRARFELRDLPESSPIQISSFILQNTFTSESLNVERFTFDELDHRTLLFSDEEGNLTIWVGGQISTSGEGSLNFGSTPFSARYRLSIDF